MNCWASQDERTQLALIDRADADEAELMRVGDDAADEFLTANAELLLHIAEDTPRGHKLTRACDAWQDGQLRDGLTCEEIVQACIWAPPGAALGHAMYVLREKLRAIAHDKHAAEVTKIDGACQLRGGRFG